MTPFPHTCQAGVLLDLVYYYDKLGSWNRNHCQPFEKDSKFDEWGNQSQGHGQRIPSGMSAMPHLPRGESKGTAPATGEKIGSNSNSEEPTGHELQDSLLLTSPGA